MARETAPHPAADVLEEFARGNLVDRDAETVAEHLASCSTCAAVVNQAPADDVLAALCDVLQDPPAPDQASKQPPSAGIVGEILALPRALRRQTKYEIRSLLGAGGMGIVYLARHRLTDQLVALKVVNEDLL